MMHKLLEARGGNSYRRGGWRNGKKFFTEKEVRAAFQLTPKQFKRALLTYRITLPWIPNEVLQTLYDAARKRTVTPIEILRIRNQEVRRQAMELYGYENLIRDGGAVKVQQDDFGTIWSIDRPDGRDKSMRWVEVVNSTPEPDGSVSHYFLRVPPRTATAKAAVAWIGGITNLSEFGGFEAES